MTQVGSAHVTISANTSQALQQVTRLMSQAKQQLQRMDKLAVTFDEAKATASAKALAGKLEGVLKGAAVTITPKLNTSGLTGELRNAMRGATASSGFAVAVTVKVKPITQAAIDSALKSVTAKKEVTIDIKGDAQVKLAALKQGLLDLKNTASTAITVNTGTVSTLIGQLNKQIADLRQIEAALAGTTRNLNRNQGGGQGGGSPGNPPRGQPASLNTQQLVAQLDALNNAYKRGDITADFYGKRLGQLKTQLTIAAQSAQAGSANFQALDRALTNTAQGMQRIQADKITKLRTELATARQAFDNAAAAATNFAQRKQAIQQYEAALAGVRTQLVALGQSGQLTASQLGTVQRTLGTIAREGNTIRGGVNIAGLSGNFLNALKGIPALASSLGGPLGAAAGAASGLAGGLGGIAALGGPVGVAIGAIVIAVGGLVTGLKASIDTAAQFEQTLTDIKALTQPTAAEFEKLKEASMNIGKPLGVGANEAASAILELNKAGVSTAEVIGGGLKGALDLAGAAGLKAAEAGVLATSAATAFGKTGKDLPAIADVFANFANKTFLGAQNLSQAIAAVGPVARSSGIDMQQFAGVMATLAQGGFKNMSDAGTSLKTMLLSLQAPTEKGSAYMKAIGVNVYDSTGKLKPFNQTIGDLRQKLVQLTPEAQKQVMKEIFGTDAVRAAEILLRVGPKAIDANTNAMKKQGEAARVAKERLESLQGQSKILGATMEEVRTRIGTPFLGALTGIVKGANSAIQALLNASKGAGEAGLAFMQMNQQSGQALNGLKNIVTSVFGNIQTLWTNVLKPVLTALAAIWSVIQSAVTTALTIVFNTVSGVVNGVKGFIGGMVSAFTGGGTNIKVSLADVAAKIQNWAAIAREYLTAVGKVAGALPKAFGQAGYDIGLMFAGLGKIFAGFALMAYDSLVRPVLPILAVVRDAFVNVAKGIGTAIQNVLIWVADRFKPLIDLMKSIGIGIADAIGNVVGRIADGIKGVVGGAADALENRAQDEAARAAEEGARKASGGATLVKEGISDIKNGISGLKTTIVDFGTVTGKIFADVPKNLEASKKAAQDLKKELATPPAAPTGSAAGVGGGLASGNTTLAQVDAKVNAGKKPKATAADLDSLDKYKKFLETLKPMELEQQRQLQIQTNNRVKLAAVIAEQNKRLAQQEAATKRQTAADDAAEKKRTALVTQIRRGIQDFKALADAGKLNSDSLKTWERKMQDLATKANLLPPALRGGIQELFNQYAALRDSAAGQVKNNDALKAGTAQTKLAGVALDAYKKALRGKSEEQLKTMLADAVANKNVQAQNLILAENARRKEVLAKAATKAATAAKEEAKTRDQQANSARFLARQLDDLNERFQNQVNAGTVTVNKLTEYRQSVDKIKEKLQTLPPDLQKAADAGLSMADALQISGQDVIDYNAELTKLKESVKGWSYEELQAARSRVEHTSGDQKKLDILDAEIKTRKTATQTILDQAAAESKLSQASAAVSKLEGDFGAAQSSAGDNLQAQYQAVIDFGDKLQAARDAQARAEGAAEAVRIQKKYDDLLKLEGLSDQQIKDLNTALTNELKANSDSVLAKVQENANKKVDAEAQAKARLDEWLLSLDRKTRDTIQAENLKMLQKKTSDAEAQLAQEIQDAEEAGTLTAAMRYQIQVKNQGLLLAAKRRELDETQKLEVQAENERFDQAIKDAERLGTADLLIAGTNQTARQRLAQEHSVIITGINNRAVDAMRDYELKVKRETGKTLQAADKEIAKNRLDAVNVEIDKNLEGLGDFTQAQRNAAQQTLEAWIEVYKAMPGSELSQPAIDALNKAIDKIKAASTKASQDLSRLVVKPEDQKGLADRSRQDILAVGKPDEREAAIADARAKFNTLIDGYQTKINELQAALKQFEGIPTNKLTPEQAALQAGLQSSLALYQGFIKNAEGAADEAGKQAGQAFADGQSDKAAEAALALVEAQHALADAEGRNDSPAYIAGLKSAQAYWKARIDGLKQDSPEYLAALQKVTDLERKITDAGASGKSAFSQMKSSFTQGQNEGIKSFNTALQGASKGLGSIASPAAIFAAILERINPAGMILEGMFSVLEEPIKALQEPFKTIGTLLGSVIAPILELIAPILDLVAQLFVALYDALAEFLKTISFGIIDISRRTPKKDGDTKDPKDPNSLIKLKNQNDLDQLDKDYQAGLIDRAAYEKGKLKLVKDRIDLERKAELDGIDETNKTAEELAAERAEINRKYDLQYQTEAAAISKDMAEQASADAQAIADADLAELDNMLAKGLISRREYEERKLQITIDGLNRQRAKEIADAEGNATRIAAINRKYDAQIEKEKMDSLARIKEAYISIGNTLSGALDGGIKDSLTNAVKERNFGTFRSQFAKNLKAAMFDAVLSAAIEAAAFKAILQPAINALTDALESGDQSSIDKAISGLLAAGNKVTQKAKDIYKALTPLADAWHIGSEQTQTQQIEVVGSVSSPVMKVSLDMLAYLADSIKQVLPSLVAALELHTPALTKHTEQLAPHTLALQAHTQALPTFVESVGTFRDSVGINRETSNAFSSTVDRMNQIVTSWGQKADSHAAAMAAHAQALGQASTTSNNSNSNSFKRKGG